MHQKNTMATEATRENGYKTVPMPADLRDELRRKALDENQSLYEPTAAYVRQMIKDKWRAPYQHSTVYVFTKLEEHEMLAMEKLAAECNLSLAGYVRAYHEHLKQNK
jgi:hypothetical protein